MASVLSIRDLESLSGIKAHTIRIWEKRYGIFSPIRTATNIRTYGSGDLKKLLNIVSVMNNGMKISKASSLSEDELNYEIESLEEEDEDSSNSIVINKLIIATINCDILSFDSLYEKSLFKIGIEQTIENLIYPLLNKIGLLWTVSKLSPAQEHFASQLVRQKLFSAINNLPIVASNINYLLFLPDGENHEIGLLYAYYLIKKSGKQCVYLGINVPLNGILECVENTNTNHLFTMFITPKTKEVLDSYFSKMLELFPTLQINVAGLSQEYVSNSLPKKIHYIQKIEDLKNLL